MTPEELLLRRAVVFASVVIYWAGVWVQARRVRKRIGRSPNVRPRGPKERLLWAGWLLVVAVWLTQPFLAGKEDAWSWLRLHPALLHPATLALGALLATAGYAGTLWCYAAMGDAWRMGINQKEKNPLVDRGPYRLVRHPIYFFQLIMLAGAALLLPNGLFAAILVLHVACVWIKALDEESYLVAVHGQVYRDYLERTGGLFPKIRRRVRGG